MKLIHNERISLAWAFLVELVVHGLFGLGAFLFGQFLGKLVFGPAGENIGAWVFAIFVFGAAMQAFVLGEYLHDHVKAYERVKRDGSYLKSWERLRWIVMGLEVASLLFRFLAVIAANPGSPFAFAQGTVTVIIGGLALWYAYHLAKVIHASVNRPPEYDVGVMRDHLTRSLVGDGLKYESDMTAGEKAMVVAGDYSALDNVSKRKRGKLSAAEQEAERQEDARRKREQEEDDEFLRNRGFIDHLIHPFAGAHATNQADSVSQNGHRN